jgi:mono/diheme cytochrome c family protein
MFRASVQEDILLFPVFRPTIDVQRYRRGQSGMKFKNDLVVRTRAWIFFSALAFVSTSCGLIPAKDSGAGSATAESATTTLGGTNGGPPTAFVNGFYAFATAPGMCVQCHGSTQTPLFAVSNVSQACNNLVAYVDLANPSASPLAQYAGNSHCGIASVCGSNTPSVTAFIQSWSAAVTAMGTSGSACTTPVTTGTTGTTGTSPTASPTPTNTCPAGLDPPSSMVTYTTAPMAIPSPLPSATAATGSIVRWNLTTLTPALAAVDNAILEVQVQSLNSTTYRVISPKLIVPGGAITVGGLHVLINGCEVQTTETWAGTNISTTIQPTTIPNPLPTTSITATELSAEDVLATVQTAQDKISIGFETLQAATTTNANASFAYLQKNLFNTTCVTCHVTNPGTEGGGISFATYASTITQVKAGSASTSPLYLQIAPGGTMPQGNPGSVSAAIQSDVEAWINNGAPNN